MRHKIFISYSRADKQYLKELKIHLKPLVREADLVVWSDSLLEAGQIWDDEIKSAIDESFAAILLISPHFLASDYINQHELPALLSAASHNEVALLPVIVSDCLYESTDLAQFMSINDPTRPLRKLGIAERDKIWATLAREVDKVLLRLRSEAIKSSLVSSGQRTFLGNHGTEESKGKKEISLTKSLFKNLIIEIELKGEFESFKDNELTALIKEIHDRLPYGEVKIRGVRRSSVKVAIEIPIRFSQKILELAREGELEAVGVVNADVMNLRSNFGVFDVNDISAEIDYREKLEQLYLQYGEKVRDRIEGKVYSSPARETVEQIGWANVLKYITTLPATNDVKIEEWLYIIIDNTIKRHRIWQAKGDVHVRDLTLLSIHDTIDVISRLTNVEVHYPTLVKYVSEHLSIIEREVLTLLAGGFSYRQIGRCSEKLAKLLVRIYTESAKNVQLFLMNTITTQKSAGVHHLQEIESLNI